MYAGTSTIDITPTDNVNMDGMIRDRKSIGVHDPLYARAVVMANNKETEDAVAIVSVEICGISARDALSVRQKASESTGIPYENIIIAATHTHSGPATLGLFNKKETKYTSELKEKLVSII